MANSNYNNGFRDAIVIRGLPLSVTHPGKIFWVGNSPQSIYQNQVGASDGNLGTFNAPFSTLVGALSKCQHGRGDIIMVKPGHKEEVADGTSVFISVNSVAIIGLGQGNQRPTFTFTTATSATIQIRTACVTLYNLVFNANFAAITSFLSPQRASSTNSTLAPADSPSGYGVLTTVGAVTGTFYPGMTVNGFQVTKGMYIVSQLTGATGGIGTYLVYPSQTLAAFTVVGAPTDLAIVNCEFRDITSTLNAISILSYNTNANTADGLFFSNNRIYSLGTTAATTAIKMSAANDRVTINDNYGVWAVLNNTAAMLATGTGNMTNFEFARNSIVRPNTATTSGLAISTSGTAWTGQAYDNRIFGLNNSAQIWIDTGTGLGFNQNYCPITAAADKSGLINPAAV